MELSAVGKNLCNQALLLVQAQAIRNDYQVSVLPKGITVFTSPPYPGSSSDLDIFIVHIQTHRSRFRKRSSEHEINKTYRLCEKYLNLLAVFVEKGYYRAKEIDCAIYPLEKSYLLTPFTRAYG